MLFKPIVNYDDQHYIPFLDKNKNEEGHMTTLISTRIEAWY